MPLAASVERAVGGGRRAGKSKGRTRTRHPVTQLLTQWQGIPSKLREGRVPNTAEVASSGAAPSSTPEMAPVFSLVSFSTRESSMGERRKKRPKRMQGAGYRLLHRMRSVFFLPGIERERYPSIIDRPIHSIHLRDTIHSCQPLRHFFPSELVSICVSHSVYWVLLSFSPFLPLEVLSQ